MCFVYSGCLNGKVLTIIRDDNMTSDIKENKETSKQSDEIDIDSIPISLFETFPREVGRQKWWCPNRQMYDSFLRLNNGYNDCYCSIYRQTIRNNEKEVGDANEIGAVVDKIYLDFDTQFGHESMQLAHEWLDEKNILHRVNVSGRWQQYRTISYRDPSTTLFKIKKEHIPSTIGFHVYFWIVQDFTYKKSVVYEMQKAICAHISSKLKSGWGIETVSEQWRHLSDGRRELIPEWELPEHQIYSPVDRRVWGDLVRISRIPNTWNPKRQRFCIPMTRKMVEQADPHTLNELSKEQMFFDIKHLYLGNLLYRVPSEFDKKQLEITICDYHMEPGYEPNPDLTRSILKHMEIPYCIRKLLSITTLDWELRFWLIVYLRERGLNEEQVAHVLTDSLRPDYAEHAIFGQERQVWRAFNGAQRKSMMPNCYKFSGLVGCRDVCHTCFRYKFKNPVYR